MTLGTIVVGICVGLHPNMVLRPLLCQIIEHTEGTAEVYKACWATSIRPALTHSHAFPHYYSPIMRPSCFTFVLIVIFTGSTLGSPIPASSSAAARVAAAKNAAYSRLSNSTTTDRGGDAFTGNTGNVNGGSVVKSGDSIVNNGPSKCS